MTNDLFGFVQRRKGVLCVLGQQEKNCIHLGNDHGGNAIKRSEFVWRWSTCDHVDDPSIRIAVIRFTT